MENYKKHVIVEKPMALRLADLDEMAAAARESNVKIFPVYQNRYNKAVQKVREDILDRRLGKLVLGTVRVRWCRPQRYYDKDIWRGTWAMDGGALTNQGIHYIDLLEYLMGDVISVRAMMATQLVSVEVEDTFVATMCFENGALGVIEITTAARPDDFEASISILAENGTAILGGLACNLLDEYTLSSEERSAHSVQIPDAYGFGHWGFFRDVISDLREGKNHPISFEEGSRAIRLLNAFYSSAEKNEEVVIKDNMASKNLGKKDSQMESKYTFQRSA
jgi:predicted dehydrogenase